MSYIHRRSSIQTPIGNAVHDILDFSKGSSNVKTKALRLLALNGLSHNHLNSMIGIAGKEVTPDQKDLLDKLKNIRQDSSRSAYDRVGSIMNEIREYRKSKNLKTFMGGPTAMYMAALHNDIILSENADRIHSIEDVMRVLHENHSESKPVKQAWVLHCTSAMSQKNLNLPAVGEGSFGYFIQRFRIGVSCYFDVPTVKSLYMLDRMIKLGDNITPDDRVELLKEYIELSRESVHDLPHVFDFRNNVKDVIDELAPKGTFKRDYMQAEKQRTMSPTM